MKRWRAMEAEYRFTRRDGQLLNPEQQREMDDSLFELIAEWAQQRDLAVVGGARFERALAQAQAGAGSEFALSGSEQNPDQGGEAL